MTNARPALAELPDGDLLIELRRSVAADRTATAHVIEVLGEVDARRLYLAEGCSSLFTYCTQVLHLSEHAAYGRIAAARVARRVPSVVDALRLGDITLTTVCLVAPHLTPANSADLLAAVRHKSKRDVEQFVAALAPKPDIPARVRKVPARATTGKVAPVRAAIPATPQTAESGTDAQPTLSLVPGCADAALSAATARAPARPATIAPLAPERYKIQFTASRETHDKLRGAQDLLRHTIPDADVAAVIDRALTLLVEELERRKLGATTRPRPPQSLASESRYIPAAVKRSVWSRDEGRCTFVGTEGRCTERGFLEFSSPGAVCGGRGDERRQPGATLSRAQSV